MKALPPSPSFSLGKTDSCRGDSGSAIQAFGPSNGKFKMILYGIVSFGVAACGVDVGFPGVYTRVTLSRQEF